jgi:hypothetical protein
MERVPSTAGRCRGHPAEKECAVAGVELGHPLEASDDELALRLGDIGPIHGPSKSAEGVNTLTGLLPQKIGDVPAKLGRFLRQLAGRLIEVFSGIGRALRDLNALASTSAPTFAVARATRVSFSSVRLPAAASCSCSGLRWAILVMGSILEFGGMS